MTKKGKKILSWVLALSLFLSGASLNVNTVSAAKGKKVSLPKSVTITVGKTKNISLKNYKTVVKKNVKYISSNKKVASVKGYGRYKHSARITAKKVGTTTISVKVRGKKYKCRVKVVRKKVIQTKKPVGTNKPVSVSTNSPVKTPSTTQSPTKIPSTITETNKPESTTDVPRTEKPSVTTEEPKVTEKPSTTEVPKTPDVPTIEPEKPSTTQEPSATEAPSSTPEGTPSTTEQPSSTEEPTQKPTATEVPSATPEGEPSTTEQPSSTEEPTQKPTEPTTTEQPSTTEQPVQPSVKPAGHEHELSEDRYCSVCKKYIACEHLERDEEGYCEECGDYTPVDYFDKKVIDEEGYVTAYAVPSEGYSKNKGIADIYIKSDYIKYYADGVRKYVFPKITEGYTVDDKGVERLFNFWQVGKIHDVTFDGLVEFPDDCYRLLYKVGVVNKENTNGDVYGFSENVYISNDTTSTKEMFAYSTVTNVVISRSSNLSKVTNMNGMFSNTPFLETVDLLESTYYNNKSSKSEENIRLVEMFKNSNVKIIKMVGLTGIVDVSSICENCHNLEIFYMLVGNGRSIQYATRAFKNCERLYYFGGSVLNLNSIEYSEMIDSSEMFMNCKSIGGESPDGVQYIDKVSISFGNKLETMDKIFSGCSSIESANIVVEGVDESKHSLISIRGAFENCVSLRELEFGIDATILRDASYLCYNTPELSRVTIKFDTEERKFNKIENMDYMFYRSGISDFPFSNPETNWSDTECDYHQDDYLVTTSCKSMNYAFSECENLSDIVYVSNWYSSGLGVDSIEKSNIFEGSDKVILK